MNIALHVTKRDGRVEPIDLDKIHRVVEWAAEGLKNVSVSQVELNAHLQFYEGIKTSEVHETLIKSAADLISEDSPDYQYLAARLAIFHLRKKAYGGFEPPRLYDHVKKLVKMGKYDKDLLKDYSREEWDKMNDFIDHWRDMNLSYAAVQQLEGKYLVQNRVTKEIYESAQFLYLLVAACLFSKYPKKTRLDYVKRFYDATSTFKISLPTPIMAGVRTPTRQFSSCVLIECDDTLDSINATASAIVKYVSQRAGIGVNAGAIRAIKSPIRGGEAFHTGCIPFYKYFQSAVKSCSQGGVRGGAATVYFPLWHLEVEELLVLKNNRGVEDNRVRHMDYGVQLNRLMYQRLKEWGDITLFSPHDVPDLYQAFFADQEKFEELYVKYEQDPKIRKKSIKAVDLFAMLMQERASTGRIYIQNVDHCNSHSAFNPDLAPVKQSNLCLTGDAIVTVKNSEKGEVKNITLEDLINNFSKNEILVLSYNEKTKENEFKLVTAAALTQKNAKLMQIKDLESGYVIRCTPEHKIYTKNRGYVMAKDLKTEDELLINKNTTSIGEAKNIEIQYLDITEDVFDITVEDNHNFYANNILVHNCLEISLPTKPLDNINDEKGEIALCTLSAFNLGTLTNLEELEELSDLVVRALDSLLDYQDYPVIAARKSSLSRRSLGVGVINYAYYLAKNGVRYSDGSANNLTHKTFEAIQYYLLKASMNLAKEQGACKYFNETTYAQGLLPIDTYKKAIDSLTDEPLHYDWEQLRKDILEFGLRNSTLTALMPSETSSQISNATSGIEPPRGYISIKSSKDGSLKQVVPELDKLKNNYELLWDIPNNEGYLQLVGIMQKFVDQAISSNTNYDPKRFEENGNKVPMKVLLKDLLTAYKYGLKTLYYHNTRDGSGDKQDDLVMKQDEDECVSCKI